MKISAWWLLVAFIVFFALMKQCEGEPKTTTTTEVNITEIIDSVRNATLKDVKTVYIDTSNTYTKWLKGETITKDSIVYRDKPNDSTITANQYTTEINSDSATAKLSITTTGELLDVQGVITYPQKETIKTTTITRDASGFYIYGSMPIRQELSPELGVMFQMKNKIIIGAGVQYDNFTKQTNGKITLGIKL